tara:strand:- start:3093 stop:3290 length:198 start_codon:yes stop_codon:yes gene_type:complete
MLFNKKILPSDKINKKTEEEIKLEAAEREKSAMKRRLKNIKRKKNKKKEKTDRSRYTYEKLVLEK